MNVFIVHAQAKPRSFNEALFRTAIETPRVAPPPAQTFDLAAMRFNPVSDHRYFTRVETPDYLKQQTLPFS